MLLSYETSSIAYDNVDLIHGKFVPAHINVAGMHVEGNLPVRFFCNVGGVFSDVTGRFAERYDNYVLPMVKNSDDTDSCVIDTKLLMKTVPRIAVDALLEEDDFWRLVQPYPWYMLLMQEFYNHCAGEFFLILHLYNGLQIEDRVLWIARHFGNESKEKLLILSYYTLPLLVRSRNDVLIDADLVHIEKWCDAGGSAFWWPELNGKCVEPASILVKRVKLLKQAVRDLKSL
jgi:hypothetical protein